VKLYIKQRVFSWRDRFFVKDEAGYDRYAAEGELFTWGKKLHIYDASGAEVAFVWQKVMSFLPRFFVEINGREVCEIVKEFTFFRHSYRISGMPWHLNGDFLAHEYSLDDSSGRQVMWMSKKWFTWGDSYELDIPDVRNELLCLCIALAVDCAMALQESHSG